LNTTIDVIILKRSYMLRIPGTINLLLLLGLFCLPAPALSQERDERPLGSQAMDYQILLKKLIDRDITVLTLDGQAIRGRVARVDSLSLCLRLSSGIKDKNIPYRQIRKINRPGAGEKQGAQAGNLVLIIASALLGTALLLSRL
jgi:hypothetical protein